MSQQDPDDPWPGGLAPPLPVADRRRLLLPADWIAAEAGLAHALADAALAVGRLDADLAATPSGARAGAIRRLALIETEAMLWAQGTPLRREEIGRDLMEARADTDLAAMAQARWAVRRLEGQSDPDDPRGFLGLHRVDAAGLAEPLAQRPAGAEFDDAAQGFLADMQDFTGLHPLSRGPVAAALWRIAGLSATDDLLESAVWCGRRLAGGCEALVFLPLGRHGRSVWNGGGAPAERLGRHLGALRDGATEARAQLLRVAAWASRAREACTGIRGQNPARVIAALAAHPLMNTAMVEDAAGISRDTAERLLARMAEMGLVREITGTRRFRLWTAAA